MENKKIDLAVIFADLNKLNIDANKYRINPLRPGGDDKEFIRMWDIYSDLREKLISVNPDIFNKLRELKSPKPETNSFDQIGHYQESDIIPLINDVESAISYLKIHIASQKNEYKEEDFVRLNNIFKKFHNIVRQLRERYNNRPTVQIDDEYDVQYLLHALLRLYYYDIRPEEWTPSYAGGSSRMDFLLKDERIVIETKKTRKGMTSKILGEQLIIDKEKYSSHPDCKSLYCFVYDPEGIISNPVAIEKDLSITKDDLSVIVIIEPK